MSLEIQLKKAKSMATTILEINLNAIRENWICLNGITGDHVETSAVVKANGYGLGSAKIVEVLRTIGVKKFYVATAEEGVNIRQTLNSSFDIFILSGYMNGDRELLTAYNLNPIILSKEQWNRFTNDFENFPFAVQINTGMNRLGMEKSHFLELHDEILLRKPSHIMSHLSSADNPESAANNHQLIEFKQLTKNFPCKKSLSATGGIFLGSDFFFDLCRPGIGIYGGFPKSGLQPVVSLKIPVIQVQEISTGEGVGYDLTWKATKPTKVATVSAGYADGLIRSLSNHSYVFADQTKCPVIGRISMDLITVDVSNLQTVPNYLEILNREQTVCDVAAQANTIPHEILVSLSNRYKREYIH